MGDNKETLPGQDLVLRSYVPRDTPENIYRTLQGYHLGLVGLFLFWTLVRAVSVLGTQVYIVSETAITFMPVEVRSGVFGALICVLLAAFNLTCAYGVLIKETWGWWLGLVGLVWGLWQCLGDAFIAVAASQGVLPSTVHLLIALGLFLTLGWLIYVFLSPGMQAKFEVRARPMIALGISASVSLLLAICFFACVWSTTPQPA